MFDAQGVLKMVVTHRAKQNENETDCFLSARFTKRIIAVQYFRNISFVYHCFPGVGCKGFMDVFNVVQGIALFIVVFEPWVLDFYLVFCDGSMSMQHKVKTSLLCCKLQA